MNTKKSIILFITCLLLIACTNPEKKSDRIDDFSFTNQDNKAFGLEDLKGSIWIADFIFTECTSVCRPMTSEMAKLQEVFQDEGIAIEFVSFSVDPTTDSPEKLKKYADDFTNDFSNWNFLTGYTQEEIEVFARDQFQTIVQKPNTSSQVIHSSNFYLIDQDGHLVNEYNYIVADYSQTLLQKIKELQ